jgi:hypothetical protein
VVVVLAFEPAADAVTVQMTLYPPRGRPVSTLVLVCPAPLVAGKSKLCPVVRYCTDPLTLAPATGFPVASVTVAVMRTVPPEQVLVLSDADTVMGATTPVAAGAVVVGWGAGSGVTGVAVGAPPTVTVPEAITQAPCPAGRALTAV